MNNIKMSRASRRQAGRGAGWKDAQPAKRRAQCRRQVPVASRLAKLKARVRTWPSWLWTRAPMRSCLTQASNADMAPAEAKTSAGASVALAEGLGRLQEVACHAGVAMKPLLPAGGSRRTEMELKSPLDWASTLEGWERLEERRRRRGRRASPSRRWDRGSEGGHP